MKTKKHFLFYDSFFFFALETAMIYISTARWGDSEPPPAPPPPPPPPPPKPEKDKGEENEKNG